MFVFKVMFKGFLQKEDTFRTFFTKKGPLGLFVCKYFVPLELVRIGNFLVANITNNVRGMSLSYVGKEPDFGNQFFSTLVASKVQSTLMHHLDMII